MNTTAVQTQLTASSTNDEIRKAFEENEAFQNNKVVVACIEPTSNEDVVRLMLVQNRTDLPAITSTANPLLAMAMGWKNDLGVTIRHYQNMDATIAASVKVTVGETAEHLFAKIADSTDTEIEIESISIGIEDTLTPSSWTNGNGEVELQQPLKTSKGRTLTHKGLLVYRNTVLNLNNTTPDVLLTIDKGVALTTE